MSVDNKIKILFTIPNFDTAGSGKHMIDLITHLDSDIFEPCICCEHDGGMFFNVVKKLGYSVFIRNLSPSRHSYLKGIKMAINNAYFFKQNGFDLIHSFHWQSDWFEPLSAKLARIPWVYTKKSMVWNKHWTIRNKLSKWTFTLNPEMLNLYPIDEKKSSCVGLGPDVVNIMDNLNSYNSELIKKQIGANGKKVILSIANLVPVKNIELLFKAFSRLHQPDQYYLLIIGDFNTLYGLNLKQMVKDLGLQDNVNFVGKVLEVEKFLSVADLYVQPSLSEASGVACMEACSAGIPSIGSNVPGLRFVLGNEAYLFESNNLDQLVEKMNHLLSLPAPKLQNIGQELQQRMLKLFHIPSVAKDHEKVYLKMIKKIYN